ncbi:MAG: sulfite exporter TauE/SafE family protein [Paracoccaceae bacterium]
MEQVFGGIDPFFIGVAVLVTVVGGFVKGAVGFAMPMIMISAMGSFMPPELALAALIVPTVVANVWQGLRGGLAAAWAAAKRFRFYISIVLVCIALSAQLVRILPASAMLLILGLPITLFALMQLVGWRLTIRPENRRRAEVIIASFAGLVGGISGVWGPPTVAYLTALDTPKADHMRTQGVVYASGAVVLFFAHLQSGVLNAQTLPLSLALVAPALAGMMIGFWAHDRLDQERFRKATLAVLVIAGLNLVRRGLMA